MSAALKLQEPPAPEVEDIQTDWVLLPDRAYGDPWPVEIDIALLHPLLGVALIEFAPRRTENALARFEAELDRIHFGEVFRGSLPVVHLVVPREDVLHLPHYVTQAFARQPGLFLLGGDGWVEAVQRILRPKGARPVPVPSLVEEAPIRPPSVLSWQTGTLTLLAALGGLVGLGAMVMHDRNVAPPVRVPVARVAAVVPVPAPVAVVEAPEPAPMPEAPVVVVEPEAAPVVVEPEPEPEVLAAISEPPAPPEPVAVVLPPPEPVLASPLPSEPVAVVSPPPPAASEQPVPEPVTLPPMPAPQIAARYLLDARTIANLLRRGNEMVARGDFYSALQFFARAADAGSIEGAWAAGRASEPDAERAGAWYRRAKELEAARGGPWRQGGRAGE